MQRIQVVDLFEMKREILSWCPELEPECLKQAKNLACHPLIHGHVCLMPDAHTGYGMPIGGAIVTKGGVIPNAVGVDIGCGMTALNTKVHTESPLSKEVLRKLIEELRKKIPVGFAHRKQPLEDKMPVVPDLWASLKDSSVVKREYNKACHQIGTLGGGNHFIELQVSEDGFLWLTIHSGSRNLGKQVCDYYNQRAKEINAGMPLNGGADPKWDLAYLPESTEEYSDYLKEMDYCIYFAQNNRNTMLNDCIEVMAEVLHIVLAPGAVVLHTLHNYATRYYEDPMAPVSVKDRPLYVHRKGAVDANSGHIIIPGSQGTCTYIGRGLGNPLSYRSCSHGAGRKMGRGAAIRNLNLEEEIAMMDKQGIVHSIRGKHDLDEAPSAYKSIDEVMENQHDLVVPETRLTPLAVLKG